MLAGRLGIVREVGAQEYLLGEHFSEPLSGCRSCLIKSSRLSG
jgi:hypothetical protein